MKLTRLYIRTTIAEKNTIRDSAKGEGKSISKYILDKIFPENTALRNFRKEIVNEDRKEKMLENNINQIAKYVNSNKNLDQETFRNYEKNLSRLVKLKEKKDAHYSLIFRKLNK